MKTSVLVITAAVCFGLALWSVRGRGASGSGQPPHPERRPGVPIYSHSGYDITPLSPARIAEIVKTLTPEQVRITQQADTERPFSCGLLKNKQSGIYVSVVGGLPLFRSVTKFESGTGWPSFFQPIDPDHIIERRDDTMGMARTEILDARSGSHLGHVFDDGPPPTGKRYCMNGEALKFIPDGTPLPAESRPVAAQTAYFAGGCFWGVEDVFAQIPGVMDAESGYQGGTTVNPSYEQVSSGKTGHAEAVKVVFDPARVSYKDLLKVFFDNHDATTPDRQGPDHGTQYRSAIFAATTEQLHEAQAYVQALGATPAYHGTPIVTKIQPAPPFYRAEDYHQDYHAKHGGSCKVVRR